MKSKLLPFTPTYLSITNFTNFLRSKTYKNMEIAAIIYESFLGHCQNRFIVKNVSRKTSIVAKSLLSFLNFRFGKFYQT